MYVHVLLFNELLERKHVLKQLLLKRQPTGYIENINKSAMIRTKGRLRWFVSVQMLHC